MLHDHVFWDTVVRTIVFTIVNVGLTIVLGTLIALLLPRISAWVRVLLTVGLVLVWAMPVVVAVQVFYWMTNFENGVLNYLAAELHLVGPSHDWYATPTSSLAMVTLLIVWGALPFIVISIYAGLAQVPHELVEAARVDGAGPLRIFRDVTFPVLKPILLILTSLSIIWDFGVFAQPYLLIGASHIDSTNYLMGVYVFIKGYADHDFGPGRGDLAADAVDGRRDERRLRPPDGEGREHAMRATRQHCRPWYEACVTPEAVSAVAAPPRRHRRRTAAASGGTCSRSRSSS